MTGKRDRVTYRTSDRKAIRIAKHTSGRHGANESPFMYVTNGGRAVAQRHTRRVKSATNKTYKGREESYYQLLRETALERYNNYDKEADLVWNIPNLSYSDKQLLERKYRYLRDKEETKCNNIIQILNRRFGHKYKYIGSDAYIWERER